MTNTTTPAKKQWQKPEIYLLDKNNIEGGGVFGGAHEVNDGGHNRIRFDSNGHTAYNPGAYNNYQHS